MRQINKQSYLIVLEDYYAFTEYDCYYIHNFLYIIKLYIIKFEIVFSYL